MLVKRYQGKNEEEAIAKAKADLGEGLVILHTKQLSKKGIIDITNAAKVEVIVALDQDLHVESPNFIGRGKSEFTQQKTTDDSGLPSLYSAVKSKKNDVFKQPQKTKGEFGKILSAQQEAQSGFKAYAVSSYSNVKETPETKGEGNKKIRNKAGLEEISDFSAKNIETLPETARKLCQHLLSHEVQEEVAQKLSLSIQELISGESSLYLEEAVNICIGELIRTSGGLNIVNRPAVIAFVGPTGVGKTTTIAKLAAHYHLKEDQKISLITVDTYRIAAVEQLKTYATYIGVPLEIALTPREMYQLVRKYQSSDLILIDTPGRSQRDSIRIQELSTILSAAQPTEVHLLLNVTTQNRILWDIVRGFSTLSPNRLLFTKLDESVSFGHILNMGIALGKPISYLTTGQDVPDDIKLATIERITEYLLQEEDVHLL